MRSSSCAATSSNEGLTDVCGNPCRGPAGHFRCVCPCRQLWSDQAARSDDPAACADQGVYAGRWWRIDRLDAACNCLAQRGELARTADHAVPVPHCADHREFHRQGAYG
ncbi:UNVERIFIED_CONTAM: hypothetical protein NCL1_00440 [Trichonephila clavipes]